MTDSASTPYMIKYIVAGNYEQYVEWINRKGLDPRAYRYVRDAEQLRGILNISGFFIGTFKNRKDIEDIKITILLSKRNSEDSANFINDFLT